MSPILNKIEKALLWAAGLSLPMLALAGLFLVIVPAVYKPPSAVSEPAKPASELRFTPTLTVPTAPVKVYAPKAKRDLKLPASVKPTEQVIAAAQVRAEARPQTVTTVLDTATGESRSFVKTDPYPWFALEPRGEVRLMAGYKLDAARGRAQQVVRLAVGYDFVRVKAFTIGVSGSIDSDGDSFAGVGISYRW